MDSGIGPVVMRQEWWFGSRKLLLVEDNLINQEVTREILSSAGFDLDICQNSAEAVQERDYDMVPMDNCDDDHTIIMARQLDAATQKAIDVLLEKIVQLLDSNLNEAQARLSTLQQQVISSSYTTPL